MAYTQFTPYLKPGSKVFTETESSVGTSYEYHWNNTAVSLTTPVVGELWEDGRLLTSVTRTTRVDNSKLDDMSVSTVFNITGGGPATTTLEQVRYQIRWNPNQLPLLRHPYFADIDDTELKNIIGWEYEQDPLLKVGFEYKKLDSNGVPSSTTTTIPSGGKDFDYLQLRRLGFDSYTEFLPVWQKISTYRGESAPGVGTIGQYVPGSAVDELPSSLEGFQYIKSADSAERIGQQARWQRTEEWTGFTKVYFDVDSFDPAGNLP